MIIIQCRKDDCNKDHVYNSKELFVSLYNNTIVNKNKISILTNEGDDDNFVIKSPITF